ncbi:hypothetical protein CDL12_00781 [Handroanthus impetiginosus]|uniref:Gnk2-homologous domain-containing protein n=1 Tax=Handroanthus impetiginosus TaxID=429701 RepID=A0A2G9I9M6_9LAMI|nr:hypothetical protein CDL12_00781 [Handroanthus impetiginosus]
MSCESCKLAMIILLVSIIVLLPSVRSQDETPHVCLPNGNYTSNSTYRANLNSSLSSLSANMGNNGFNNASVGRNPDQVNAIALCRADTTLAQCRTCLQNAAVGIVQFCPNQRQAIIWYELCTLRYSNEAINGTQPNDAEVILRNTGDVASPQQFRNDRARLLDNLTAQAANGSSEMKIGAGSTNTSDSDTLYGLVQCTPDLSADECNNCLVQAGRDMRSCCDSARGVRVLFPSCILRYELYPFYNETRLREFQALLPPVPSPPAPSPPAPSPPVPSPSPPGSGDDNTTKIIIIVVVAVVVCLILAVCGAIFLRKRVKQRRHYEITETTDETSSVESLQYDFGKIRAATNDFADSNKLGQGGFGVVYKTQSNVHIWVGIVATRL